MNTLQELPPNAAFTPPCSAGNFAQQDRADLPTNKANNNEVAERQKDVDITSRLPQNELPVVEREQGPFAANAYHVPPKHYAASCWEACDGCVACSYGAAEFTGKQLGRQGLILPAVTPAAFDFFE